MAADFVPDLPPAVAPACVAVWAQLLGLIGFEVFGQFTRIVEERDAFFRHTIGGLARTVGLRHAALLVRLGVRQSGGSAPGRRFLGRVACGAARGVGLRPVGASWAVRLVVGLRPGVFRAPRRAVPATRGRMPFRGTSAPRLAVGLRHGVLGCAPCGLACVVAVGPVGAFWTARPVVPPAGWGCDRSVLPGLRALWSVCGPASSGLRAPQVRPRAVECRSAVPPLLASPSVCGPVSGLCALRSCLRGGRGPCGRFLDCAACGACRGVGLGPVGVSRFPRLRRRPAARVSWTAHLAVRPHGGLAGFASRGRPCGSTPSGLGRGAARGVGLRPARAFEVPRLRRRPAAPRLLGRAPRRGDRRVGRAWPRPRTPPPWSACAVGLWTGLAQAPRLSRRRDRTPSRGVSQAPTPPGRTSREYV